MIILLCGILQLFLLPGTQTFADSAECGPVFWHYIFIVLKNKYINMNKILCVEISDPKFLPLGSQQ